MRNKRKGILMASAILGSAAIVSTGFAAWVVTNTASQTTEAGNVDVDTVDDQRISISAPSFVDGDSTITFGYKESSVTTDWLTNNNEAPEDLDVSFTFKASWKDSDKSENPIVLNYKFYTYNGETLLDDSSFNALNTYNTLTLITPANITVEGATLDKANGTITCTHEQTVTVTIAFGWGTAFGGKNPYQYFNTLKSAGGYLETAEPTDPEIDEAIARLKEIKKDIENLSFKMTLSNKEIDA